MLVDTELKTNDDEWARYLATFLSDKIGYNLMDDAPTENQLYNWIVEFNRTML